MSITCKLTSLWLQWNRIWHIRWLMIRWGSDPALVSVILADQLIVEQIFAIHWRCGHSAIQCTTYSYQRICPPTTIKTWVRAAIQAWMSNDWPCSGQVEKGKDRNRRQQIILLLFVAKVFLLLQMNRAYECDIDVPMFKRVMALQNGVTAPSRQLWSECSLQDAIY